MGRKAIDSHIMADRWPASEHSAIHSMECRSQLNAFHIKIRDFMHSGPLCHEQTIHSIHDIYLHKSFILLTVRAVGIVLVSAVKTSNDLKGILPCEVALL